MSTLKVNEMRHLSNTGTANLVLESKLKKYDENSLSGLIYLSFDFIIISNLSLAGKAYNLILIS